MDHYWISARRDGMTRRNKAKMGAKGERINSGSPISHFLTKDHPGINC